MAASNRNLFKLAAGLAVVTIAGSFGWSVGRQATPALDVAAPLAGELASASVGRAAEHRKQIFDERRAHYLESRGARPAQASAQAQASVRP